MSDHFCKKKYNRDKSETQGCWVPTGGRWDGWKEEGDLREWEGEGGSHPSLENILFTIFDSLIIVMLPISPR